MKPAFYIYDNSMQNILCGVVERLLYLTSKENGQLVYQEPGLPVLKAPIKPKKDVWRSNAYYINLLAELVGKISPISNQDVIDSRPRDKVRRFELARDEFDRDGLQKRHAIVTYFVKGDKFCVSDLGTSCPRIIAFPSFVYGLRFARWIVAMESLVYKAINKVFNSEVVMKCKNCVEVANAIVKAWKDVESDEKGWWRLINMGDDNLIIFRDHMGQVRGLRIDARRWDQHNDIDTVIFKQTLYHRVAKGDPEFKELLQLLSWQRVYRCEAVGRDAITGDLLQLIVENVIGLTRSGDFDTALGAIVVATSSVHGCFRGMEKPTSREKLVEEVFEYFHDRGFELKLEGKPDNIYQCEFCQCRPLYDGTGWRMVRNMLAVIKDTYSVCDAKNYRERMSQIGTAGCIVSAGVPVFQALYSAMLRCANCHVREKTWESNEWRDSGLAWMSGIGIPGMKSVKKASTTITQEARYSMLRMYDITPEAQEALEKDFDDVQLGDDPGFRCMLDSQSLKMAFKLPEGLNANVMGFSF